MSLKSAFALSCLAACLTFACGGSSSVHPPATNGAAGEAGAGGAAEAGAGGATDAEAGAAGEAGAGGAAEAGAAEAGAAGDAGAAGEQGMFTALGVNTQRTPRTYVDASGATKPLPAGYNPLGVGVKTLEPLTEIYMGGRGVANSVNEALFDDLQNSPTATPLPLDGGDESWTANTYSPGRSA